jgi:hypothetical protein
MLSHFKTKMKREALLEQTFSASIPVDREDEDAFGRDMRQVGRYPEEL